MSSPIYTLAAKAYDAYLPGQTCQCGAGTRCPYNSPHITVEISGYNINYSHIFGGGSVFMLGGIDKRRSGKKIIPVELAPPVLDGGADLPTEVVLYLRKLHVESPVFFKRPTSPLSRRSGTIQPAFCRNGRRLVYSS